MTSESLLIPRTLWALDGHGYRATALTVDPDTCIGTVDPKLLESLPSSVEVIRTRGYEKLLTSCRLLPYRVLEMLGMTGVSDAWVFSAVARGRDLLGKKNFDVIYSRASTWASNLVGLSLKRHSGLPWVAHFSDPWVDNPYVFPQYNHLQQKRARAAEASILREADGVVFTTDQTADVVMAKYPDDWRTKVHVIPHGYDPRGYLEVVRSKRDRLTVVHAGVFFGPRTPMSLFRALALLQEDRALRDRIELNLVGPIHEKFRLAADSLGVGEIVKFHGVLAFDQTLKMIAEADVLTLIEADQGMPSIFLPSKLVDYLGARKVILGITPLKGAAAELLRSVKCPVVSPHDADGISRVLADLIRRFEEGRLDIADDFRRIAPSYDIRQVTQKLTSVFEGAIRQRGTSVTW